VGRSWQGLLVPALVVSAACADAPPRPIALPPPTTAALPVVTPVLAEQAPVAPSEEDAVVPVSLHNPTWGSRTAPVTIVEYSDFQCPYCGRVEPTLDQIRTAYGPDKVRIVWKNNPLPFHVNGKPAAEAGAGVFALEGNDAFWVFHALAFQNQGALGPASYAAWAQQAGVTDVGAFTGGLEAHRWAGDVDKDLSEGKVVGVSGTPAFFVNGLSIKGAQPFETFKEAIDQQLAKASAKLASGTPAGGLYAAMAKDNWTPPEPPEVAESKEDTTTVFKIPVGKSPVRGSPGARVTIVEYADLQCPFCARVEPVLKAIRDKYGDKVRLVWKNEPLPFHVAAEPAAQAALEVRAEKGDAAFWSVHDSMLAGQASLMSGQTADVDAIVKMAVDAGAAADRVKRAVETHAHKDFLGRDEDEAESFQANGTPHFFINGRRLVGAQPEERFAKIIEEELAKSQALIDKGTRPTAVYDALVKDGKGPPEPEKKDVPKGLPANDPERGNARAKVTVHEWADFQCPFCGRVEPTLVRLVKEYGDRVRFVWHDQPLRNIHPRSELAAQAGREAFAQKGAAAFWAVHDKMFANQKALERTDLDGYATELGLDLGRWNAALDGEAHAGEIDADKSAGYGSGLTGTPSFLIVPGKASSGYFINGAQAYARFHRLIERALAEAK
jgi:protein-disulfide isomerase